METNLYPQWIPLVEIFVCLSCLLGVLPNKLKEALWWHIYKNFGGLPELTVENPESPRRGANPMGGGEGASSCYSAKICCNCMNMNKLNRLGGHSNFVYVDPPLFNY